MSYVCALARLRSRADPGSLEENAREQAEAARPSPWMLLETANVGVRTQQGPLPWCGAGVPEQVYGRWRNHEARR